MPLHLVALAEVCDKEEDEDEEPWVKAIGEEGAAALDSLALEPVLKDGRVGSIVDGWFSVGWFSVGWFSVGWFSVGGGRDGAGPRLEGRSNTEQTTTQKNKTKNLHESHSHI